MTPGGTNVNSCFAKSLDAGRLLHEVSHVKAFVHTHEGNINLFVHDRDASQMNCALIILQRLIQSVITLLTASHGAFSSRVTICIIFTFTHTPS